MPAVNDIVRAVVSWDSPVGGVFQNTFTMLLTSVATSLWSEIADDVEAYLEFALEDWLDNVATSIVSNSINLLVRDTAAHEWNSVLDRSYTGLVGVGAGDTSVSFASPKLIMYPGLIRHWGFRNLPPPVEGAVNGGSLSATAVADMVLSGAKITLPRTGTNCNFTNGVLSLATETFRGFTGAFVTGTAVGSRVTRKEGDGI